MQENIKAIIDTNIFISALMGSSITCTHIYDAFAEARFTPVLSLEMQLELFDVLHRPKFNKYITSEEIKRLKELLKNDSIFVFPRQEINICRDPKDNIVLEAALAAEKIDCIVSGDEDLLILKAFRKIPIITPKEFLSWFTRQ